MPFAESSYRQALLTACIVTLATIAGLWTTVQANYGGDWTGLFCIGGRYGVKMHALPKAYNFPGSTGYDGQFYRAVAHDPFLQTQNWVAIDRAELRYRRILVPLAAWLLAGGQSALIDGAYIAIVLSCLFLGVAGLSLWLARHGLPPAAGALFLFLPASLISLDRMLPDIALITIFVWLLFLWKDRLTFPVAVLLTLAPLVRDIGVLLTTAAALTLLFHHRRFTAAFLSVLTILPAALWTVWLHFQFAAPQGTPREMNSAGTLPHWVFLEPGYGIILRILNPLDYASLIPWVRTVTRIADIAGWLGILLAILIVLRHARAFIHSLSGLVILLSLVLFVAASPRGFWADAYSYPRAYTPLLALLAWEGWKRRQFWWALPLLAVSARILYQLTPQVSYSLRWLLGA
ncbi:MAG: hypothetical protein M9913_23125 [Bryobacteraceae bacterium]|nr:hypothetical protein [Solibacteraceae bacterium]MCL4841584.1 hypothetical protein [Bryobacteraceae bacterium]MCO5353732.1 hypothetical protein [Bryobacteraceae bacterium]